MYCEVSRYLIETEIQKRAALLRGCPREYALKFYLKDLISDDPTPCGGRFDEHLFLAEELYTDDLALLLYGFLNPIYDTLYKYMTTQWSRFDLVRSRDYENDLYRIQRRAAAVKHELECRGAYEEIVMTGEGVFGNGRPLRQDPIGSHSATYFLSLNDWDPTRATELNIHPPRNWVTINFGYRH